MEIEKAKEFVTNYMISKGVDKVTQYGSNKTSVPYCDSLDGMFLVFNTLEIENIKFFGYKGSWSCEIDYYSGEEDYSQLNAAVKVAGEYILAQLRHRRI